MTASKKIAIDQHGGVWPAPRPSAFSCRRHRHHRRHRLHRDGSSPYRMR